MTVGAATVDGGVVSIFVALALAAAGAAWKLASLRTTLLDEWSDRIDVARAKLSDKAIDELLTLQKQIGDLLLDSGRLTADPAQLSQSVERFRALIQARDRLTSRFRKLLRIGPTLLMLLAPVELGTLVAGLYYSGFNRARLVGQCAVGATSLAIAGILFTFCRYVILLHRLGESEILASDTLND
ncbi:MAG: hypothetical protein QOI95_4439 [Acidimicrobiaceae bacterium]|jgi:hypothetical protein